EHLRAAIPVGCGSARGHASVGACCGSWSARAVVPGPGQNSGSVLRLRAAATVARRRRNPAYGLAALDWSAPVPNTVHTAPPTAATPASSTARWTPWSLRAIALEPGDAAVRFCITHPFHPLYGQTLDLVAQGREWGEERVYYRDRNGRMRFLPARWTNLAAPVPVLGTPARRAGFGVEDLIRVQDRLKEWKG